MLSGDMAMETARQSAHRKAGFCEQDLSVGMEKQALGNI